MTVGEEFSPDGPLSLRALERIARKCLDFEAAWLGGNNAKVEDFVADSHGLERSKLLCELLLLDLDYRQRQAEQVGDADERGPLRVPFQGGGRQTEVHDQIQ